MLQIWLAFLAGLAGSFHCIGMCGGVVAALSLKGSGCGFASGLRSQLSYNLGRVATYTLLGAVAGLAGSSLDLMALKSASRWFLVAANLLVIMAGLSSALGLDALGLAALEAGAARCVTVPLVRTAARSSLGPATVGLFLGLLPCGLVYAPLIAAAGTGSMATGAATMAALGLGTLPAMLGFGTASNAVSAALRNALLRVAGLLLALLGTAGLWRALGG